ncbi:Protein transport protein yif1 [Malassezia nana]|uniref:Protein transport protein yif1 n=1 Tax=Malassezia nana TaxID=180528 RepID=A0AAF0J382_9BASI|nr:Protein transport protein yif1 [Malassezia nana]
MHPHGPSARSQAPPLQRPVPTHARPPVGTPQRTMSSDPSQPAARGGRPPMRGTMARPPARGGAARGGMGARPVARAPPASEYQRIRSPPPVSTPSPMSSSTHLDMGATYTPPPSVPHRAGSAASLPQSMDTYQSASAWMDDTYVQQNLPYTPQQDMYGGYVPESPARDASPWDSFAGATGFQTGNMMNDATAQMGMQFGRHVAQVGGAYVQKNFRALLPMPILKHYFKVSNSYVLHKLRILIFPWHHKPWSRRLRYSTPYGGTGIMSPGQGPSTLSAGMSTPDRPPSVESARPSVSGEPVSYCVPREDVNSPDMYIPLMAFVTYVIATSIIYGLRGRFHPEVLGYTASRALAIILIEFFAIKLGCYLLNIQGDHTIFDLLAYSGYKFVGTLAVLAVGVLGLGRWIYWLTFLYMFASNAFFLLRSLRYVVLPDPTSPSSVTVTQAQRTARIQFLFGIAMSQMLFGWLLIVGVY